MARGRKPIGQAPRSAKIVVCLEKDLYEELQELARESQRTLSDYCRFVLQQHFLAVRTADGTILTDSES